MTRTLSRRASRPVVAAVAIAAVALLSACSPTTTDKNYSPSDGIATRDLGDVRGINLLVVSAGEGEPGVLHGAFSNHTSDDATVTVSADGAGSVDIDVPAGGVTLVGTDDGVSVEVGSVDAAPGALLPITVSTGGATEELSIPVLDGTLPEYSAAVPTATAPAEG